MENKNEEKMIYVCRKNKGNHFSKTCQYRHPNDGPCIFIASSSTDQPRFCPYNEDEPEADWKVTIAVEE